MQRIGDGEAARQETVGDAIILDFDRDGHLLGIEVLNASRNLRRESLS